MTFTPQPHWLVRRGLIENVALAVDAERDGPEGLLWLPGGRGAGAGSSTASPVTGHTRRLCGARAALSWVCALRPIPCAPSVRAPAVYLVTWGSGSPGSPGMTPAAHTPRQAGHGRDAEDLGLPDAQRTCPSVEAGLIRCLAGPPCVKELEGIVLIRNQWCR